ncbi:unnamed protein product [Polarella glacialis]|uniref:TLC domain-containing protein n=1 Tax=Polarella glacialis TaxID=89957 RepID=A0A813FRS8_POLGL|nr:unnamed protein product [Polarella glacialis]CAE8718280.1 unnamed protein product [Polarella glacialis]|mmetsp:Transcript_8663/g.13746  ORF Transcript_8663/g.13746 Transcript_8663/m.13746 type:complete len:246 (+) Transcript_8663:73-810(+)
MNDVPLRLPGHSYAGFVPLELLCLSFLFWGVVLLAVWLSPLSLELKRQHADRVASCLHAVSATLFGFSVMLYVDSECVVADRRHHWILVAQMSTAGWTCVDIVSMLVVDVWFRCRAVDSSVFIHHVLIVICLVVSTEWNCGLWHQGVLMVAELSVLPLNAVHIMRFYSLTQTSWYTMCKLLTALLWILCRLLVIPFVTWRLRDRSYCLEEWGGFVSWGARAGLLTLFVLNACWLLRMRRAVARKH